MAKAHVGKVVPRFSFGLVVALWATVGFAQTSAQVTVSKSSVAGALGTTNTRPRVTTATRMLARQALMTSAPRRLIGTTSPLARRMLTTHTLGLRGSTTESMSLQWASQQTREHQVPPRHVAPMTDAQLRAFITPTSAPASLERAFSLVHSSNRRSTVETCHCPAHPLGGIDREARILDEITSGAFPMVYVDAGGFLRLPPNPRSLEGAAIALEAVTQAGVHAVNVGVTDLAPGLSFYRDLQTSYSVPFVSANIRDKKGKDLFAPYKIVPLKLKDGTKVNVALVGITRPPVENETSPRSGAVPEGITIAPPQEVLEKLVPQLRKKADVVILLAYYTREDAPKFVGPLPKSARPDVVVCGEFTVGQRREYYLDNAHLENGIWYLTGGFEGRQLGHCMISLDKKKNISQVAPKLIEVEQSIPQKPEFTRFVEKYQKRMREPEAKPK